MNLVYSGLMQVLAILGFGFVTYQGFETLISSLTSIAKNNWHGVGGDLLSLLDMMGFTDAIGYILSAVSTKAALATTKKFLPTK